MNEPEPTHHYAIRGGKEGKDRLDLLARVMLPTTVQLFDRVGLKNASFRWRKRVDGEA
jgi:hypothetical protein